MNDKGYFVMLINNKSSYAFFDTLDLPKDDYLEQTIAYTETIDWLTTAEFQAKAHNHCGAVTAANIALFYNASEAYNFETEQSNHQIFYAIHQIMGDGPIIRMAKPLSKFFRQHNTALHYRGVKDYNQLKKAIDNNHICTILLMNALFDWHWVLAVGYRQYANGDKYIRIVDSWHNSINRYYKLRAQTKWWAATEYWL